MKRLVMLAVLCAFVFGMAATASAADIKASGAYTFEFIWSDTDFQDNDDNSNFDVYQRLRTKFEFIANENLKGVLYTEQGTDTWGEDMTAGSNVSIGNTFQVKAGYIDFNWPGTEQNIKVGHFGIAFPSAVAGSPIMDDEASAALLGGPITENVDYAVAYVRAHKPTAQNDFLDLYYAALPVHFEGVKLTPFVILGNTGEAYSAADAAAASNGLASYNGTASDEIDGAWWAGVAFELNMFDPFVLKADVNYGQVDSNNSEGDRAGWYAAASLAYNGWDFMKPELFFAYTSGEDGNSSDDLQSERMPTISNGFAVGSFFFGGDWGLSGSIDAEDTASMGFWTVGVSLKEISFFEGMEHTVHILYAQGTNDEDLLDKDDYARNVTFGRTLTEDDNFVEIDLNTSYSIYDELTAYVELGWIHADWDNKWEDNGFVGDAEDNAYKVSMGLNYEF